MAGSNIFLSIVVPFYNEADNIIEFSQELQKTFKDYSKPWEIVFVDDGSTDDSIEKLKASIEDETNCRIVKLSANVGRNAALCAGLNYADGRYVGVISADLQYHPSQLLKLENELGDKKLDMVAGYLSSEPTGKRLGDRMLYSLAVNGRLRDPICSLRIFSRKLIGRIKNYSGNTYNPLTDLPRLARSYKEVEVERQPRKFGENKVPRGVDAMPAQYRGHWMKFDMFSVAGIAAGIVIAFSSILLALFFLYTGDIPEGSYSDALARKMAATVVILGLFSGLALAMLASALRSTARLLLPLPSPIRYDRQETFSHPSRSSSDNRSSRSRRRPQRRGGRRSSPGQNNRGSDRRSGQSRKSGGDSGSGQQGQQQQKKEEPPVKPMETNGSPVTFEDVLRHTNENGDSKSGNSSSNRRPRRGRRRSSRGSSQQKDKDSN